MGDIVRSAGAVVFWSDGNATEFLLLKAQGKSEYWDMPKGHIEQGESPMEAARREIQEETGLTGIEFIPEFEHHIKYRYKWEDSVVNKEVIYFLAKTPSQDVHISHEHKGFAWKTYQDALKTLSFSNQRVTLRKVYQHLRKLKIIVDKG